MEILKKPLGIGYNKELESGLITIDNKSNIKIYANFNEFTIFWILMRVVVYIFNLNNC